MDKLPEKLSSVVCWGGTTLLVCGLPAVVGLASLVREAVPRDKLVSWPCKPWIYPLLKSKPPRFEPRFSLETYPTSTALYAAERTLIGGSSGLLLGLDSTAEGGFLCKPRRAELTLDLRWSYELLDGVTCERDDAPVRFDDFLIWPFSYAFLIKLSSIACNASKSNDFCSYLT
mgnify:CR=1 FL=1